MTSQVGLVPLESLVNALVVVVANLKPADLRGKLSAGMILAASTADGAQVGVQDAILVWLFIALRHVHSFWHADI